MSNNSNTTRRLTKRQIGQLAKGKCEAEFINALYQHAVPGYENCRQVKGYPKISPRTKDYIWDKIWAMRQGNNGLPGFLWWNAGFDVEPAVKDWEIDLQGVTVE